MVRVDLRTVVLDVPPQDVITRDNVSVKVNAVLYFRVLDPQKAIIQVEDFLRPASWPRPHCARCWQARTG
jgi:regulator of protease activity HflC (stomatin/prohibitin superfamily)